MNLFISIHKFETPQTPRKKIERQIRIDRIKISKLRHDCVEILIWFDFEQVKKNQKKWFWSDEKKNSFIFFCYSFFFFTLRHLSKVNSDNFVFLNLIKNSDYDVQIISTNVFSIFSLIIQKNKKKNNRAIDSQSNCFWFFCALFLFEI